MGFMDYSIEGSDTASNDFDSVCNAIANRLQQIQKRSDAKDKNAAGDYINTPGWMNAIILFAEMIAPFPDPFASYDRFVSIARIAIDNIDELLKEYRRLNSQAGRDTVEAIEQWEHHRNVIQRFVREAEGKSESPAGEHGLRLVR